MRFNLYYVIWCGILFCVELGIALFVDDDFIRPYVGDVLVVILIYTFVRAFFKVAIVPAAVGVWGFACGVEILQYFNFIEVLGWEASAIARTVIGTTFSWEDWVAYTLGLALLLASEKGVGPHKHEWSSLN
jgi:hypothetical protein